MSTPYNVLVTTRAGTPVAVLDRVTEPKIDLTSNAAAIMSFSVPRGDTKLQHLTLASFVELRRGATRVRRGRVINREITPSAVYVTAMTEEGLLLDRALPTNYGMVLGQIDLADAVRAAVRGYHTTRIKWKTQWDAHTTSLNIATETYNNGVLMLAKDGTGTYQAEGYAIYTFNSADVPNFDGWDRIRWSSDFDEPVYTTIQYRFGTTGTFLPDTIFPAEDGKPLTGTAGGIPDQIGVGLNGDTSATLQVRCNLYTSDTSTPDPAGTAQKGVTPFFHALEVIARQDSGLTTFGIPATTGVLTNPITTEETTALQAVRALCDPHDYAFTIDNLNVTLTAPNAGADMSDEPIITAEDTR